MGAFSLAEALGAKCRIDHDLHYENIRSGLLLRHRATAMGMIVRIYTTTYVVFGWNYIWRFVAGLGKEIYLSLQQVRTSTLYKYWTSSMPSAWRIYDESTASATSFVSHVV